MSSRHFYNSSDGLVLKSLRGAVLLNPSLRLHPASRTVYTIDRPAHIRVSVISGGGAGHEPAYGGYIGRGMLSAGVSGEIFASPSSNQIVNTIRLAAFGGGSAQKYEKRDVLVVINNYTGDRLNFGLGMEKARVLFPEIESASVVVADDVALLKSPAAGAVGPRGLAGNILICKLLGALADTGASLDQVKAYGEALVSNLASIGMTLEHCSIPGQTSNSNMMANDECEIGLGLHNEAGVNRRKMRDGVAGVIKEMVQLILDSRGDAAFVGKHSDGSRDETVLFANNLGGVSQLELGALMADLADVLATHNIYPHRIYLSSFMTSLNAPGFSASLLNISRVKQALGNDWEIDTLELLDAPTDAHSWTGVRRYWSERPLDYSILNDTMDYSPKPSQSQSSPDTTTSIIAPQKIEAALKSACLSVLQVETKLTDLDTIAGDGDCGHTFARGARAVLAELERPTQWLIISTPIKLARTVADLLEDTMGGTIGALFGIYLNAYARALETASSPRELDAAPLKALEALSHHTPAKPGDRTVIDALHPFCHELAGSGNLREAVKKALAGAENTRGMKPVLGRATYIGEGVSGGQDQLPPDPGAVGIAQLLDGFVSGFLGGSAARQDVK